jgi:hypothetical protein
MAQLPRILCRERGECEAVGPDLSLEERVHLVVALA